MLEQAAAAVVAVHRNQDPAAGVRNAFATGSTAESAKHHRVNDPQPGTGQHRNRQLRHHGHMNGDAVTRFESGKVSEQGGQLIHPDVKFLIGDGQMRFIFRFRHKDEGRFVFILLEMAINTVVGGIDLAAHKPFPARGIAGIQRGMPILVPIQQIGIFLKTFGEILQAQPVIYAWIGHICLGNKLRGWMKILLFLPVNGNLRFTNFQPFFFFSVTHRLTSYIGFYIIFRLFGLLVKLAGPEAG